MGHDWERDRDFDAELPPNDPGGDLLREELANGETILWQGQPRAGMQCLHVLPISVFGLVFVGFAAIWFLTASSGPFGWLFGLAGLLPLIVGLAMVLAPVWVAWAAGRTRYAVTNRRVILCEPSGFGIQVRSYIPAALTNIVRTQRWDGSGDLIFEEIRTRDADGDRHLSRQGFRSIDDVRRVEALIRSTLLDETQKSF